ncbi:MAG: hypothetical protein V2I43_22690 [Parvularcula sp.]|jgi:hypothetical protein|nr:hypothetical protein [Parvularcula sp.]
MRRLFAAILLLGLPACVSDAPVSQAEAEIGRLARERRGDERFPVLRPLPEAEAVRAVRIPPGTARELRMAAADLEGVIAQLEKSEGQSVEETAEELRVLVRQLQSRPASLGPLIDREALGIPTPPPR